ncbi:MAG: VOC family protein [Actinomycetia bacterium]|nr:VOC family protein [Actinomycetes bacterium]MCP4959786.1 VOC family protein [Actinomycetes bacterium]
MAVVDHLVYRAEDLGRGGAFLSTLTGVSPAKGGPHPGVGTHNSLLSLGEETYLEIIAPDPNQPEPLYPRPFGVAPGTPPLLVTFAVHPGPNETLESLCQSMIDSGFDPGPNLAMSRVTPQGETLNWRLTVAPDGPVPFVIDWGDTMNPGAITPKGCSLAELHCSWPDPEQLRALHDCLGINSLILKGEPSIIAVLDTPHGPVDLR